MVEKKCRNDLCQNDKVGVKMLKKSLIFFVWAIFIFILPVCKRNSPPTIPIVPTGPDSGYIDNYTFFTFSEDPDGDSIAIKFYWGDGDTSDWTPYVKSNDTVFQTHFYGEIGNYEIRAKAKDKQGAESEWSESHNLKIGTLILWSKQIGGFQDDYAYSIQPTLDNHYVIVGNTTSYGAGRSDVYLIKIDTNGNVIWEKTYGGANDDYGYAVKNARDGGYIIVGMTNSYGAGGDLYLIKTDDQGNMVWQKFYGGTNTDYGRDLALVADGYIITGMTTSFGIGAGDVWLIKTNNNGDTLWTKTFGGTETDCGNSVILTNDNCYTIAGFTNSFANNIDIYLIKTDAQGEVLWAQTYGTSVADIGNMVRQTADNGYIVVGGNGSVYVIKVDNSGNLIYTRTYGNAKDDCGYAVEQLSTGNYMIVGHTIVQTGDGDTYWIEIDAAGNVVKENSSRNWRNDYGRSVAQAADGFIIAGYSLSISYDVFLIKFIR